MTTKDKVEERIKELLPELKERGKSIYEKVEYWIDRRCSLDTMDYEDEQLLKLQKELSPILLSDILMAIEKVSDITFHTTVLLELSGSTGLIMIYETGGENSIEKEAIYNLSKQFSDQSEELYLFLLDILTNH